MVVLHRYRERDDTLLLLEGKIKYYINREPEGLP